ncbi:MAG: alpha-L-fucosidase [Thermoguttaceae bacterium]|nr:alpha-L-fucosidase [Thermoguttaceae bacterium]
MKRFVIVLSLLASLLPAFSQAEPAVEFSQHRAQELKDLKWGMFVCWSLSTFSGTEWTDPAGKTPDFFRAAGVDTDQWARTAKEAGMGYILFLAKHHDGFCLWDTKTTEFKSTNSPLKKDVLAELRKSCDKYGIKLALYFSEGDWNWPGGVYRNNQSVNPEVKKAQLKELLTLYGPIEYIWFDHAAGTGGLSHEETTAFCHEVQPYTLIGYNHGECSGEVRIGERGKPSALDDASGAGYNRNAASYDKYLAAEFTYPILPKHEGGAQWFYSLPKHDGLCTDAEKIYSDYLGAVKYGNIFSLDVGPDYNGRLRDIDVQTLQKVGRMIREGEFLNTSEESGVKSEELAQSGKAINWEDFLARQDLIWETLPDSYFESSFLGNGLMGTMIYKRSDHEIAFDVGRTDITDHRLGNFRIPVGRLLLKTKGKILAGSARLDLWNAETRFELETTEGRIRFRALDLSQDMVLLIDVERLDGEKEAVFAWESEEPLVYREKRANHLPDPLNPPVELKQDGGISYSVQNRVAGGQFSAAWAERPVQGAAASRSQVVLSLIDTFPETTASEIARETVKRTLEKDWNDLIATHRAWWHGFYPKSFVSVPNTQMESFYWIQMYKLASATRPDRHVIDLMGPWYCPTVWAKIWWNLNIQICYLPVYTANHCELGESFTRLIDDKRANLAANAKLLYGIDDGATLNHTTDNDCISEYYTEYLNPGDFTWALHNYWLQYRYTMDRSYLTDREKHAFFDMLKGSFNVYRHIFQKEVDGKYHIPVMRSPEYPTKARDTNYNIGLIRWLCERLIEVNRECGFNDPQAAEWQDVLDHLVDYQVGEDGFLIGADVPQTVSHRHWSHILQVWPLCVYTAEDPERRALIKKTMDHWTTVEDGRQMFGWSQAAAASIYAILGEGENARDYILKHHNNRRFVQCNTQYFEGGWPVIECSHVAARALQEMLLQSWGNQIRVFPAIPADWKETSFADLRTEGAFLVSAIRKDGKTSWVKIESLAGEECRVVPNFTGDFRSSAPEKVQPLGNGLFKIDLKKGETITLWQGEAGQKVAPVTMPDGQKPNPWGKKAAEKINLKTSLSYRKPVKASSNWDSGAYSVASAFDGNLVSRWGAKPGSRSGWIEVDLTQPTEVKKVVISEIAYPRTTRFRIEVRSSETDEWTTVYEGKTIARQNFIIPFEKPVEARFVRLNILDATEVPTIEEFSVY